MLACQDEIAPVVLTVVAAVVTVVVVVVVAVAAVDVVTEFEKKYYIGTGWSAGRSCKRVEARTGDFAWAQTVRSRNKD